MTIHEKLEPYRINEQKNIKNFYKALIRAGAIIITGYLFATLIAWIIVK
ncbi:MAG: hypothetical protein IJQ99_00465 [Synergistaceae bacterium]|nr:hypothetical protein [Synergistaceae bacterium]